MLGAAKAASRPPIPRHPAISPKSVCAGVFLAVLGYAGYSQLIRGSSAGAGRVAAARATPAAAFAASMGATAASQQPARLAAAINGFGNSLFDKVAAEATPGSLPGLFLSPYGIAQALAMLLNGVQPGGESYQQLQAAVYGGGGGSGGGGDGDSLSLDALNSQLQQLSTTLVKEPSNDLTVSEANSAWLAQRYTLQLQYAEALKQHFGTAAQPLTTSAAVNSWVTEATRGKITEIVDEGTVRQSVLILINAVYFKGLWEHQFKKASTTSHDFHTLPHGSIQQAAMMYQLYKGRTAVQIAKLAAAAGDASIECAAVRLPYRGGEYVGVVAMPLGEWSSEGTEGGQRALVTEGGAVPYTQALAACRHAVLSNLPGSSSGGSSSVRGAASGVWQRPQADVKLYLPRFEIEFSTSLNSALMALGVTKPFQGGDISQIAADDQGNAVGDLLVSDVVHKVYAKVDEEGTEAAAVTAVIMLRSMPMPREDIELRFDRPFVFAVVHEPTGLALFSGEVYRPEAWKAE